MPRHGRSFTELKALSLNDPERAKRIVVQALRQAGGIRSRAVRQLGIGRTTFWEVLVILGIRAEMDTLCAQLAAVYGHRHHRHGFSLVGQPYAQAQGRPPCISKKKRPSTRQT